MSKYVHMIILGLLFRIRPVRGRELKYGFECPLVTYRQTDEMVSYVETRKRRTRRI